MTGGFTRKKSEKGKDSIEVDPLTDDWHRLVMTYMSCHGGCREKGTEDTKKSKVIGCS
jgi:hypothetical protein